MARSYKGPIFAHRHYAAIAAVMADFPTEVGEAVDIGANAAVQEAVQNMLADMFQRDNPRFDRERFLAACSGNPTNGKDRR